MDATKELLCKKKQFRSPCLNSVSQIKEIFVQVSCSSYFSPEKYISRCLLESFRRILNNVLDGKVCNQKLNIKVLKGLFTPQ